MKKKICNVLVGTLVTSMMSNTVNVSNVYADSNIDFMKETSEDWKLVWEDNFDGAEPDTTIWSRIPRGRPDWQNTQSFDNRCYEMRDGCLILKGIVNDNMDVDTAKYLTGGLWTKDKHAFHRGRIEVRARLHGARGAWPAIWTLPYEIDKYVWPMGGEVDIMERLNYDSIVYQTVHSHYTYTLGIENNPKHGGTTSINPCLLYTSPSPRD